MKHKMEIPNKTSIIQILIIILLLMGIFMLYLNYQYKAELLLTPCELCVKLNPPLKECIFKKTIIGSNEKNYLQINFTLFNQSLISEE